MNIIAPKLEIDSEATEEIVRSVVSVIKVEPDSFAILSKDEMSYVQILMAEDGLVVKFQNGSLEEHYEFNHYLSRPQTIRIMMAYLNGENAWKGDLEYSKINMGGLFHSVGLSLGRFFGGLVRGFRYARKKLKSGSQEFLTPSPHTTQHADPQWAVPYPSPIGI